MKSVFHCCTVYQLIVAIQLKITFYSDYWCELIISKSTPNADSICKRLSEESIFDSVVVLDNESIDWNSSKMMAWPCIRKDLRLIMAKSKVKKTEVVDEYVFAGLGGFSNAIGQWLIHYNNCKKISMYEEGASSYSRIYEDAINIRRYNPSICKRIYYRFFPHVLSIYSNFYFFEPELRVWNTQSKIKKIPDLVSTKEKILPIINRTFAIDTCKDTYGERVIFFEESYFNDGIETGDIELVEKLAVQYGKKNIFVKNHPRNKINRFKDLGYKTNEDFSIPWEALALNIKDLDSKILVTMTSTALVSTFLCIHSKAKLIFKIDGITSSNKRVKDTVEVIKKLASMYPDQIKEE